MVGYLRAVLNVRQLTEDEERPLTRKEAVFLSTHAEKIVEWCLTMLP
jgi:hypothetical protein